MTWLVPAIFLGISTGVSIATYLQVDQFIQLEGECLVKQSREMKLVDADGWPIDGRNHHNDSEAVDEN